MFHKHKYKEIERTYAEPTGTDDIDEISGFSAPKLINRMTFGLTTILWECEVCQKTKKEELLGKSVK